MSLYLPIWCCWVVLFSLPTEFLQVEIPLWLWVIFVLGIDVGHVWSTIFRTYLDPEEFGRHQKLLLIAPFISFILVALISWISIFWFWRLLAYLALFHFVKQQYGFLALYKMKAKDFGVSKFFNDKWTLYWATLYPVLYWHLAEGLHFNWFVEHDFLSLRPLLLGNSLLDLYILPFFNGLYWLIIIGWAIEEIQSAQQLNLGKLLWMLTTAVNWYAGIVYFNSDLVFTITNVVAHGIPYLSLIIYYQHQKAKLKSPKRSSSWKLAFFILFVVFLLAWLEEYCWDMFIYGERASFFEAILAYPFELLEQPFAQAIAIAALTLPQLTHYIIDGFIWKSNAANPYVKQIFSTKSSQ
ncbi:hypothetical protein [Aureispira anguillae]|uniref:Uncharacterized protein n=1 Tax=Aureispira anguillae TaxID=2864201 RepID=A0A915YHK5_9BACT|nr:hypothetical protein [Aureispira anguillae]BDS13208.1 hypothetical protein AsAng_0039370 [Aureispira anguillae]